MELYPSDLTDAEWVILEPLIPPEKPGGRPREVDMRAVLNGIFYVLRAGCAWRMIPRDYPPKSTAYAYFARFRNEGGVGTDHGKLAGTLSRRGWTRCNALSWYHR